MNETLRLSVLDQEAAAMYWDTVIGPMLEASMKHGPKRHSVEALKKNFEEGFAKIAVVVDPADWKVYGVLYLEGAQYEHAHELNISYGAGVGMHEWIHLYPALRAWAAEQGFTRITFMGRAGWKKMLGEYADAEFSLYNDDLDDLMKLEVAS